MTSKKEFYKKRRELLRRWRDLGDEEAYALAQEMVEEMPDEDDFDGVLINQME